jgi:hypothetical protein
LSMKAIKANTCLISAKHFARILHLELAQFAELLSIKQLTC